MLMFAAGKEEECRGRKTDGGSTYSSRRNPLLDSKPTIQNTQFLLNFEHISTSLRTFSLRKKVCLSICFVVEGRRKQGGNDTTNQIDEDNTEERLEQMDFNVKRNSEHFTFLIPTVMYSLGILSVVVLPVYYRFLWQMQCRDIPMTEMLGIIAFSLGVAIHHSSKFEGVPYGLFLGPKELEDVGGTEDLETEVNHRIKRMSGS
ncbi:hypothetical protein AQUCO_01300227v1 [Aquilegia coerulea]|uniref:beta-carotene 3-hydroxylase n=1 Tax=Aquilegia coerulea TaxID=218851 RepID=A0A2G5E0H9_AQUCA|nr:hypothetical protein AQUCO_01300227v1 [Aquilegia coerulea]